jgi:hypothetical protein
MRSNTIGRLCSPNCGMIQTTTTSSADGIGRRIMSTDEIHMMIREITTELEAPPKGMNELPRKEQWVVFNGRLEMANIKNQLLIKIGAEPIRYNDVMLGKIVGISPQGVRHLVRSATRSFQKKVGCKGRREIIAGLRETDKNRSQTEENLAPLPSPDWNEEDARARMGGNN